MTKSSDEIFVVFWKIFRFNNITFYRCNVLPSYLDEIYRYYPIVGRGRKGLKIVIICTCTYLSFICINNKLMRFFLQPRIVVFITS